VDPKRDAKEPSESAGRPHLHPFYLSEIAKNRQKFGEFGDFGKNQSVSRANTSKIVILVEKCV
jgi:hypothetical protein